MCTMEKRAIFGGKALPYLLLAPQLAVTLVFFYWPASQAVWQSFLLQDAFGLRTDFVWLENYRDLLARADYYRAMVTTAMFSIAVAALSLSIALMLAVQADKHIKGAGLYKTLLIWPYAVAPAVAGVLWLFMFQPSLGLVARGAALSRRRLEPAPQRRPCHDRWSSWRPSGSRSATISCSSWPGCRRSRSR